MPARSPTWLLEHKRDVYSQTGEDGIIEAILDTLGQRDKWCVEFGAWDGQFLSNTRNLIDHGGYRAVMIEGDTARYQTLKSAFRTNDKVIPVNAFVGFDSSNGLDTILAKTPIPTDFDFCSIDIDGNDYHTWRAVSTYRPKLVCIEFNPTIPTDCPFVQPADPAINQGAGLLALVELGKSKGYQLASALQFNAFFVRDDMFPRLEISDNSPQTLRTDLSLLTYLFHGFDGKVFLHGNSRLIWHDMPINERQLQVLPRFLQKHPGTYTRLDIRLADLYRRWLSWR